MSKETEETFIQENQQVIRDYLISQFKGFDVTDTPHPPLSHMFIVTKSSDEQYRVKVAWLLISDRSNNPAKIKRLLIAHDVAGRMRGKSKGEYFSWGNYSVRQTRRSAFHRCRSRSPGADRVDEAMGWLGEDAVSTGTKGVERECIKDDDHHAH